MLISFWISKCEAKCDCSEKRMYGNCEHFLTNGSSVSTSRSLLSCCCFCRSAYFKFNLSTFELKCFFFSLDRSLWTNDVIGERWTAYAAFNGTHKKKHRMITKRPVTNFGTFFFSSFFRSSTLAHSFRSRYVTPRQIVYFIFRALNFVFCLASINTWFTFRSSAVMNIKFIGQFDFVQNCLRYSVSIFVLLLLLIPLSRSFCGYYLSLHIKRMYVYISFGLPSYIRTIIFVIAIQQQKNYFDVCVGRRFFFFKLLGLSALFFRHGL